MSIKKLYPWQTEVGKKQYNITDGLDVYDEDFKNAIPVSDITDTGIDINADALDIGIDSDPIVSTGTGQGYLNDSGDFVQYGLGQDFEKKLDDIGDFLKYATTRDLNQLPLKNPLMKYASYNYRLGLYALKDSELNDPDNTYRKDKPDVAILQTGGGLGENKVTTAYEIDGRKVEFFIDNLEIETVIAPTANKGATNAVGFRFEVMEPYSMGLFLQALQIGALQAGHKNYTEAPFLLMVEFVGWDDNGNIFTVPYGKKLLPFKLVGSGLEVAAGGSSYIVEGVAYNDTVLTDQVQRLPVDIEVSGRNIETMMQSGPLSLTTALNKHLAKKAVDGKVQVADQYFIVFPKKRATAGNISPIEELVKGANTRSESGQDITVTELGKQRTPEEYEALWKAITSKEESELTQEQYEFLDRQLKLVSQSRLGDQIVETQTGEANSSSLGLEKVFDPRSYGETQQPYGLADFTWDNEKGVWNRNSGQLQIDPTLGTLKFTKGTRIQDVITEMILISEYGRKLTDSPADSMGMKDWFKIDTQLLQVSNAEVEDQIGRKPRIYVFRVLPYKVHEAKFLGPTKDTSGVNKLKQQAIKQYDYIYSGKNDDILDLTLNMDNTFFKSISPGNYNKTSGQDSPTSDEERKEAIQTDRGVKKIGGNSGTIGDSDMQNTVSISAGAVSSDDAKIDIARRFNEAIVSSDVDMITVEMTIWGDPYYIADSGVGNYNADTTVFMNLNQDGTIDYQSGEVDVNLNFKTPIDYRDDGIMGFPSDTISVNNFSGLYQVITVQNQFSGGTFKQVLELVRRSNQTPEAISDSSDKSPSKVVDDEKKLDQLPKSTGNPNEDRAREERKIEKQSTNTTIEETSTVRTTKTRTTTTVSSQEVKLTEGGGFTERKRAPEQIQRTLSPAAKARKERRDARRIARNGGSF